MDVERKRISFTVPNYESGDIYAKAPHGEHNYVVAFGEIVEGERGLK